MQRVFRDLACALAGLLCAAAAGAVVLGASDTFESGSTNGWGTGAASPVQPVNVGSGGPAGAGDNYLLASATGNAGAGGRFVVIAGSQWLGDYIAAGVDTITMDVNNLGATQLNLRLVFFGPASATAVSGSAVVVPSGGGWVRASFDVDPAALVASPGTSTASTLSAVGGLRLYHGTQSIFPGQNIATQLGIDNVAAVPEPAAIALLSCGLVLIGWRCRSGAVPRRRRR